MRIEKPDSLPLIDGEIRNLKRFALPDSKEWSLFNPSIARSPRKGLAMTFRSSNYVILETGELHVTEGGKIKNQMWFADISDDLEIKNLRRLATPEEILPTPRGMEDPKLFWRGTSWWLTATMMEKHTPVARMSVCKLDAKAERVIEVTTHDGIDTSRPEKNWMVPYTKKSEHFDFIYGATSIISGRTVTSQMTDDTRLTGLRGSSHLLEQEDGTYIAVMHKLLTKKTLIFVPTRFGMVDGFDKNYAHFLVRFDKFGTIIQISDPFQFIGRGIEFAAGIVEHENNFVISFGKNDVSSHLCIVSKETALEMMKDVNP